MTNSALSHDALTKEWVENHWQCLEAICNVPEMKWSLENYAADLPGKWSTSRVTRLGGEVVGYCLSSVKGRYLWIHRLVVSEEQRNLSIGHEILVHYVSVVASLGLKGILLKTPLANEGGARFYEREGFTRLADLSGHAVFRRADKRDFAIGVHQPNYLPWLGYFYKIFLSDAFVFLDDVPVPKGSYTVRTKVLNNGEAKWLTVPSTRGLGDEIRDSFPAGEEWALKHTKTLEACYARAPHFRTYFPAIAEVLQNHRTASLADLNVSLIQLVAGFLGMSRIFYRSSTFGLTSAADERLVAIVHLLKGGEYLSGSGGANYQSEETFSSNDISLRYTNFKPVSYKQRVEEFVPGLSIVDALFNIGAEGVMDMFQMQAKINKPVL